MTTVPQSSEFESYVLQEINCDAWTKKAQKADDAWDEGERRCKRKAVRNGRFPVQTLGMVAGNAREDALQWPLSSSSSGHSEE